LAGFVIDAQHPNQSEQERQGKQDRDHTACAVTTAQQFLDVGTVEKSRISYLACAYVVDACIFEQKPKM